MAFEARMVLKELKPPSKIYLHHAGVETYYGDLSLSERLPPFARAYYGGFSSVTHVLNTIYCADLFKDMDFLIAALWAQKGKKIAEVFGYKGIRRWPGNPEVYSFVFKDGKPLPKERNIEDGDVTIMRGKEEEFRRLKTRNLQHYMTHHPKLGKLEPTLSLEL